MNPLTNTKNITKLSEQELRTNHKSSWHDQYKDSAWVFIGGIPYDLTEGDVIAIFSQYGEIVNINLVRDKESGKSKGFCFLCYEDQRSTILAVDNFNGIKIMGRTVRVDHVSDYKMPKDGKKTDAETKRLHQEGCAPKPEPLPREEVNSYKKPAPQDLRETLVDQISSDIKLPMRLPIYIKDEMCSTTCSTIAEDPVIADVKKEKKAKKVKKHKKKKRKRSKSELSRSSSSEEIGDDDSRSKRKDKIKHKKYD